MHNVDDNVKNKVPEKYKEADKRLKYFIDCIYDYYNNNNVVNPIEHTKCKLKKVDSIEEKLRKKGLAFTEENIDNNLHDVVRARLVCSFLSDVYDVAKFIEGLQTKNGIRVVDSIDYIKNPKESGYKSYHLLLEISFFYQGEMQRVNAEIQIRTVAMDMLFSLEHKLRYKNKEEYSDFLSETIKDIANSCSEIDVSLDNVAKSIKEEKVDDCLIAYPFMEGMEYNLFKSKYVNALNFVKMKFDSLNDSYDNSDIINPIEHIKSRIKSDKQIIRKLIFNNKVVNFNNVFNSVKDIAGIKIVCSFLSDLEELRRIIENDPEFVIIERKDYIDEPKESGYRGYHFVVLVPYLDGNVSIPVEIQLRTVAMEMWASLEEKICYHKNPSDELKKVLKDRARAIVEFDEKINLAYEEFKKQHKSSSKVKSRIRTKEGNK